MKTNSTHEKMTMIAASFAGCALIAFAVYVLTSTF